MTEEEWAGKRLAPQMQYFKFAKPARRRLESASLVLGAQVFRPCRVIGLQFSAEVDDDTLRGSGCI